MSKIVYLVKRSLLLSFAFCALHFTLVFAASPQRIVSLSPSVTEILFLLGLGDKVVGVTTSCDYPPLAKEKFKVGDFSNPNLEKIVALQPDLVFVTDGIQEPLARKLRQFGLRVEVVAPQNIEGILRSFVSIGESTGTSGPAMRLVKEIRRRLNKVEVKVAAVPREKRPKIFLEIWPKPLMTVGKDCFVDLDPDLLLRTGPRFVQGVEDLYRIFYPDDKP
ncbi:MAG: ABC transporter substrate-binding protein [Elusimicrobiota bacterium]